MTTEDLIEILSAYPGEDVGVELKLGDRVTALPIERAFYYAATRPRVRIQVHARILLDVRLEDVVTECFSIRPFHAP